MFEYVYAESMEELVKKLNEKAVQKERNKDKIMDQINALREDNQNPYLHVDPFTVVFIGNTGLNHYKESVCAVIQYQR